MIVDIRTRRLRTFGQFRAFVESNGAAGSNPGLGRPRTAIVHVGDRDGVKGQVGIASFDIRLSNNVESKGALAFERCIARPARKARI